MGILILRETASWLLPAEGCKLSFLVPSDVAFVAVASSLRHLVSLEHDRVAMVTRSPASQSSMDEIQGHFHGMSCNVSVFSDLHPLAVLEALLQRLVIESGDR